MKKSLVLIYLFFLLISTCIAQEKYSKNLVYGDLTYGFETSIGNTGFLMGVGYQCLLSKKFIFQGAIHNFRTGIILTNWQDWKEYPYENWYDHSAFLSTSLGYAVIGKTNGFNITVKGGLSLCYIRNKYLDRNETKFYPEGSQLPEFDPGYKMRRNSIPGPNGPIYGTFLVTPGSEIYKVDSRLGLGYNLGLDVNFKVKKGHVFTAGFWSISNDNPLQFLFFPIPVLTYKILI